MANQSRSGPRVHSDDYGEIEEEQEEDVSTHALGLSWVFYWFSWFAILALCFQGGNPSHFEDTT